MGISLDHLHQRTFLAPTTVHSPDSYNRTITVKYPTHLAGRQEKIVAALIWAKESESFGVTDHPTGCQVSSVDDAVALVSVPQQLTIAFHRSQSSAECIKLFLFLQAKFGHQFGPGKRHALLVQKLQYEFPAWNGVFVFLGLAFSLWILEFEFAGLFVLIRYHLHHCSSWSILIYKSGQTPDFGH
jgi:hypothetical protein